MPSPLRDLAVDDAAPTASIFTGYDELHAVKYLRLLDAEAEGANSQAAPAGWRSTVSSACFEVGGGLRTEVSPIARGLGVDGPHHR